MKIRDVMTPRPIVVGPDERPAELHHLMEAARVHHLPLVSDGQLVGLWLRTAEGPLVLLAPERAHETTPDADAREGFAAMLAGDREAVVVWDESEEAPVGLLTRADALTLVRKAMDMGARRDRIRPVVARFIGPAGAGKSTLMLRTVELMGRCQVAVVQANAERPNKEPETTLAGAPVLDAPGAHWRAGLQDCIERLADAQLIVVEDRDGPPELGPGLGEDLQILVVPPEAVGQIDAETLKDAQALVVTKLDQAPKGFDLAAARDRLHAASPHLPVFGVAAGHDDRGLEEWRLWLDGRVLSRRH